MITVSGGKNRSLLFWSQNRNNSNVYETVFGGNVLELKENYFRVFDSISAELEKKRISSFVELWKEKVGSECEKVFEIVKSAAKCSDENARRVVDKFRGNVAEIFAEKLFETGQRLFKAGSYEPVDPNRERGTDASAISAISGLKVGIQIKNYSSGKVTVDKFRTAGDESDRYSHTLGPDQFALFLSHPNQYILSFTDADDCLKEEYEHRVGFLGPKWIDGLGLQGERGEKRGKFLFFREIAEEISGATA